APPVRAPTPAPISTALRWARGEPPTASPASAPTPAPMSAPPAVLEIFCSPVIGSVVVQALASAAAANTATTLVFIGNPLSEHPGQPGALSNQVPCRRL